MRTAYDLALSLFTMAKGGTDGTISAHDDVPVPSLGYLVGGRHPSLVFDSVNDIDRGELGWWIGKYPSRYYGVWVDTEDGRIYFDTVTHMVTRTFAENLGRQRDEVAIWDIANNAEIRL